MSVSHGRRQHREAAAAHAPPADTLTPADRYAELFVDVQRQAVFSDSKTFVDCAPRHAPEEILADYRARRHRPGFDLAAFVHSAFTLPRLAHHDFVSVPGRDILQHIEALWPYLSRAPQQHPPRGSLLQLPQRYIVPGGRFAELYYWDSFFTMLGLPGGTDSLVEDMTENFAYLVDTYGHIPNGTRTYYLSRSHPPVFALMTRLCEQRGGHPATDYLPQLLREHAFWMAGEDSARPGEPHRRVVRLPTGECLNRYWDDRCTPREESWREDVATAGRSGRPQQEVYRHLRAAAESGWDFSTRWLAEDASGQVSTDLATICTTDLLPVDLNALLYFLELHIAELGERHGDAAIAATFRQRASTRAAAMARLHWDAEQGFYVDYDWRRQQRRRTLSAATLMPLYCGLAGPGEAHALAHTVRTRMLAPGGVATTETMSGQQWDRPNGWSPLQWIAVEGFARCGESALSEEIRGRWLRTVEQVYAHEHKLLEKYALRPGTATGGGGGEYPLQDGFGWTNGVVACWLQHRDTHSPT
jgi:alpha,alpha-trehalase